MKPISFHGVNVILNAPENWDEEEHGECKVLPVMRTDGMCISKWSLSWRERLDILFGKSIFVYIASGETQPPISLKVEK